MPYADKSVDNDFIPYGWSFAAFTDQASIKKAVAQGLGYVILPWQMAVDDIYISSGKIVALPLAGEETKLTTFLAYRRGCALPPAEEHALAVLRKLYSQLRLQQHKMAQLFSEPDDSAISCTDLGGIEY